MIVFLPGPRQEVVTLAQFVSKRSSLLKYIDVIPFSYKSECCNFLSCQVNEMQWIVSELITIANQSPPCICIHFRGLEMSSTHREFDLISTAIISFSKNVHVRSTYQNRWVLDSVLSQLINEMIDGFDINYKNE